jgi:hypothetical protein
MTVQPLGYLQRFLDQRRRQMLFYSDDLAREQAAERRRQLLAEASAARLCRQAKAAAPARIRPRDRLLHAAGALLVRWGTHLQGRSRMAPLGSARSASAFVETRLA